MADRFNSKNPLMLVEGVFSQLRLAGMGAVSKIQHEGGKLFESLIQEGARIETLLKGPAHLRKSDQPKPKTAEEMAALERLFDDRVARSLQRMNIPTQEDLSKLSTQMKALDKHIKTLVQKEKQKV